MMLWFYSCSESARHSRDPRINYDSLALSIPKGDTLMYIHKSIIDTNAEFKYTMDCQYPEFIHFENEYVQRIINETVQNKIKETIDLYNIDQDYLYHDTTVIRDDEVWGRYNPLDSVDKSYLLISYEIMNNSKYFLSLVLYIDQYNALSWHSIPYHISMNFNMNTGELINLEEYSELIQDSLLIYKISDFSFSRLIELDVSDSDWVYEGTYPLWENFRVYNIRNDSLILTFDVYQVAPYSEGHIQIGMPLSIFMNSERRRKEKEK